MMMDEARVGGAAGGREFRPLAGRAGDGLLEERGEGALLGQEGMGAADEFDLVRRGPAVSARRRHSPLIQVSSASAVCSVLKRMLNVARASAGMTLVAGLPTSMVVTSRFEAWKCCGAGVELARDQALERRRPGRASDSWRARDSRRGLARL